MKFIFFHIYELIQSKWQRRVCVNPMIFSSNLPKKTRNNNNNKKEEEEDEEGDV